MYHPHSDGSVPRNDKPDLRTLLAMYEQFSPEANLRTASGANRLQSQMAEDAFAQQNGAPTLQAMAAQDSSQARAMHAFMLQREMESKQAEEEYAHGQGAPNLATLRLQQQGQEHEAATGALAEQRSIENKNHATTQQAHKLQFINENPMLFMPSSKPLPPHVQKLKEQAKLIYPDLFPDEPTTNAQKIPANFL